MCLLPRRITGALLDAGCGDGEMSEDLAAATGARVVGVDLSTRRAKFATSRKNRAAYTVGSIYELPFADDSFELVVCADLLEHLDDPARAFAELTRVSSDAVIVTVPYKISIETTLCPHCGNEYYLYGHQHSFGKEGLERLASSAGARVERFEHLVPLFECRRYRWCPPLRWLLWGHFKDSGTLGARFRKRGA